MGSNTNQITSFLSKYESNPRVRFYLVVFGVFEGHTVVKAVVTEIFRTLPVIVVEATLREIVGTMVALEVAVSPVWWEFYEHSPSFFS